MKRKRTSREEQEETQPSSKRARASEIQTPHAVLRPLESAGTTMLPKGIQVRRLLPYTSFMPTCPSLTYGGTGCNQLFRYQHFNAEGQPVLVNQQPQIVDCHDYCVTNCSKWIDKLISVWPKTVRLVDTDVPTSMLDLPVRHIQFQHRAIVECPDSKRKMLVQTAITVDKPFQEFHLHRFVSNPEHGESAVIRDEQLSEYDTPDLRDLLCRLFQTPGQSVEIRVYLEKRGVYFGPSFTVAGFPNLPNQRYFGRNRDWQVFDFEMLPIGIGVAARLFLGSGTYKQVAPMPIRPPISCEEVRNDIVWNVFRKERAEMLDVPPSGTLEATFGWLSNVQQFTVLDELANDLQHAQQTADTAAWRVLYNRLKQQRG